MENSVQTYPSFKDIFLKHTENVSDKWENYLDIYDESFRKFIMKSPTILEIGVQNGGSLQVYQKYYRNAKIYGVDIDPKVLDMNFGENVKICCFNIVDQGAFEAHLKDITFDIIVDDGSHKSSDIIETFRAIFSKLAPEGVYLIEDLHASYWDSHEGGYLRQDGAIEFLKKFVDLINFYHVREPEFINNLTEHDKYIFAWVESITFYDSVVVIKKLKEPRTQPYKRVIVGCRQPVLETRERDLEDYKVIIKNDSN